MKFTLEIRMGNEAMLTGDDVAEALAKVAKRLAGQHTSVEDDDFDGASGKIHDGNGNTVGSWGLG